MTKKITLVGGGARSGKSRFALDLARGLGPQRLFVATGQALDVEMAERIRKHQESRGADFQTREEPLEIAAALRGVQQMDVVVVDCLTLWLSNMLLAGKPADQIEQCVREVGEVLQRQACSTIVV